MFSSSSKNTPPTPRRVQVTAGTDYAISSQKVVAVNGPDHTVSPTVKLSVHLRDYSGLPTGAPSSSPCFDAKSPHASATSVMAFTLVLPEDTPATDLYIGIDTEENPCRKYGVPQTLVNGAVRLVTSTIDSTLISDASADSPYIMAPLLRAKTMTFSIGDKQAPNSGPGAAEAVVPVEGLKEGATGSGVAVRAASGMPDDADKRRRWAKTAEGKAFVFEAGRAYTFHFAHSYINWGDLAISLPGMTVHPLKYAGAKSSHKVRLFLEDVNRDRLYLVIYCRLLVGEDLEKALEQEKSQGTNEKDAEMQV